MKAEAPFTIPPDIAAKCEGPDQFEKFDRLFRGVIAVPKAALAKEETKWERAQAKKRFGHHAIAKPLVANAADLVG